MPSGDRRIAYVVNWRGGVTSGPFRKIAEQVARWPEEGLDVGLFVLTDAAAEHAWADVPSVREVRVGGDRPFARMRQKHALCRAALRWQPDVAYHRYSMPYPGLFSLSRRVPTVLEINTRDIAEYDMVDALRGRANRLLRVPALRSCAGLVFVTQELARHPEFTAFAKPHVTVANGITLSDVVPLPPSPARVPTLAFLAQPGAPWHGVDKILDLAAARPRWRFHIIGPSVSDLGRDAPGNVICHGLLKRAAYREVLAEAHVALGTLALHRNGMDEASPLKTREYLALGLPVIIGYHDTDFLGKDPDYLLTLPNNEENVRTSLEAIDAFVSRWLSNRVPRAAVDHLDAATKERMRARFLAGLAR